MREFRFDLGYAAAELMRSRSSSETAQLAADMRRSVRRRRGPLNLHRKRFAIPRTNPLDLVLEQRRQGLRLPLVSRRTALWKGSEFMRRPLGPVDAPQKVVHAAFTIESTGNMTI